MASVSITNQTLTLTIDINGVETVIRKDNCKVVAIGDVVRITDYRGSIYEFLYSDCTAPDEASANDLRDAIEAFLNTAGGGGGGGITDIESTTLDVSIADGVATVDLPYEAIPLAGTENIVNGSVFGSGRSATLAFESDSLTLETSDESHASSILITPSTVSFQSNGAELNCTDGVVSISSIPNQGLQIGTNVNLMTFGIFSKYESGVTQAAAIADATNATDVITQLNTLLAAMRAYGFIAE
jgi:hypothetical protein